MLFGPTNIYSGSAGIGIFYLRLYEATGDEQYLEEAKAAADHIISVKTDAGWYEKTLTSDIGGVIPVPAGRSVIPTDRWDRHCFWMIFIR